MKKFTNTKLVVVASATTLALAMGPIANAVVVVGGDNGWEVSFDGSVSGFYIYQDPDDAPTAGIAAETRSTAGAIDSSGDDSRVRSGLLPAFFSFNVQSPTVNGLTGSAKISVAPVIQNDNTKNNFADADLLSGGNIGNQSGSSIDLREAYFDVDGTFGTFSIGRALSLYQRHNYLTDMSLLGVGAGGDAGSQITLGHSGYGYLYPNYNARIAYTTPDIHGLQLEVGVFDPSEIGNQFANPGFANQGLGLFANETDTPRFEGEATFGTAFPGGRFKAFVSGLWQEADYSTPTLTPFGNTVSGEITAWGVAGGAQVGIDTPIGEAEVTGSGYRGDALGSTLMLDEDALDPAGVAREHQGWLAQGSFRFNQGTKLGFNYGMSEADETAAESVLRTGGTAYLREQNAWTVGVYHDVTDWFKLVAEYSNVERQWFDGQEQENDVLGVGGFFSW